MDILSGLLPFHIPSEYKLSLLLDGKTQKNHINDSFSSEIYYITQETYLGRETIQSSLENNSSLKFDIDNVLYSSCLEKYKDCYDTHLTSQLSGGEKKRLSIAKALVSGKKIIIMDEITNGLDSDLKKTVLRRLLNWKDKYKLTYIVISHDMEVLKWCDDIVRL